MPGTDDQYGVGAAIGLEMGLTARLPVGSGS